MAEQESVSTLRTLLVPLVKLALADAAPEATHWRRDVEAAQLALRMAQIDAQADLGRAWPGAVALAERDPAVRRAETVNPTLPLACPVSAADLLADRPDWDAVVTAIRDNASFG